MTTYTSIMKIHFYKYQATGNDFVMIDNRSGELSLTTDQIQKICDRKFGVGADGLMLIENDSKLDFNLVYYNQDGSQSLCGNGSRAAMSFASSTLSFSLSFIQATPTCFAPSTRPTFTASSGGPRKSSPR